jgi:hypothetical protein
MFLHCSVHHSPKQWKHWLPLAELWYNSTFHSSIGCSPFRALYGYDPNLGVFSNSAVKDASVLDIINDRAEHTEMLKIQLAAAQNRMKIYADRNREDRVFQVGQQVLLRLQRAPW